MPPWFLDIPVEARTLAVFVLGLVIGGQLNRGIYRLAWQQRAIGPWSAAHAQAPARKWHDYLPVFGWFGLAREAPLHGRGYWVRPILIELGTAAGLAGLYWLEMHGQVQLAVVPLAGAEAMLHQQFVSRALLICLMIVATFIDFDEKTIPDWITVPGMLAGLALATLWPLSLPIAGIDLATGEPAPLLLPSPAPWPAGLNGANGLALGLFCYVGWCYAIAPKFWTLRRGWKKAFQYLWASMAREPSWWVAPLLAIVGSPLIVGVWLLGGARWEALLSALGGMAFGGALVWGVRVIGSSALGKEAMGFGDVTLMAMLGAFVGWQGALMTFFLAPFAALGIALLQWLLTGRRDIAFGPYLCVGALIVVLRWPAVWQTVADVFLLGRIIPVIVMFCLGLMWMMLAAISWLKSCWEPYGDDRNTG